MFIVIELQTNANNEVASIVSPALSGPEAESRYHTILAAAALSNVPKHAAVILNDKGELFATQCYYHDVATSET